MTDPDRSRLELRPPEEERLRALRSQPRPRRFAGCRWFALWLVVGAAIWVAGILIVASVVAAPRSAPVQQALGSLSGVLRAPSGIDRSRLDPLPLGLGSLSPFVGVPDQGRIRCSGDTPAIATQSTNECGLAGGAILRAFAATALFPRLEPIVAPGSEQSEFVNSHDDAPAAITEHNHVTTSVNTRVLTPAVSHGIASWFDAKGYQGAVPWWRAGQPPVWATLSRFADGRTYSVTLLITGFCACLAGQPGERLIDLSPAAFRALGAPLRVGLIEVTMQVPVQGPRLPATDTEGSARDGG